MTLNSNFEIFIAKILGFDIEGWPKMSRGAKIIIDRSAKIVFGQGVLLRRNCELRANNNARLSIGDSTLIDNGVRIIAYGSSVEIGENCKIGFNTVINGGGGVKVGDYTKIYGFCYVQSSSHIIDDNYGDTGKHRYLQVNIGCNVLLYGNSVVKPGSKIPDNMIIEWNTVYE